MIVPAVIAALVLFHGNPVLGQAEGEQIAQLPDFASTIPNFAVVSPRFLRGAAPSDEAIKQLGDHGVKTIIDLRWTACGSAHEKAVAERLHINYIHLPMGYLKPTTTQLEQFLRLVSNPRYQPVYVHCRQGADRTGTLVGVYRMVVQNWSFNKTYSEMRQHHFKPWLYSLKQTVRNCQADATTGLTPANTGNRSTESAPPSAQDSIIRRESS
jgi:protein tyrosine/serine phosphatase